MKENRVGRGLDPPSNDVNAVDSEVFSVLNGWGGGGGANPSGFSLNNNP